MEQYLRVGIITSTHGIKGEVKVYPTTDNSKRYEDLKEIIIDTGKEQLPLIIQGVKFFKKFVILKFKGIDDINDVEKYKGSSLMVLRENAVSLKENEYYIADLIGLKVYTDTEGEFGYLEDVIETGANDVYIINTTAHGQVLVPAIRECILQVDLAAGRMDIHLMPGLI